MHFQVKVTEVAGLWLYCCCCVFSSAEMLEGKKKPKKKKRKKKEQNKCIKLPFCFSSLPSQSGMIFYPKAPPCIFSFSFAFKLLAFRITMAGSCAWCIGVLPKPVPLISFEREREGKRNRRCSTSIILLCYLCPICCMYWSMGRGIWWLSVGWIGFIWYQCLCSDEFYFWY